jgi:uncharacterized Zn finger protein
MSHHSALFRAASIAQEEFTGKPRFQYYEKTKRQNSDGSDRLTRTSGWPSQQKSVHPINRLVEFLNRVGVISPREASMVDP